MNNTTKINIFNSDTSNITYINTQNCMITITYRILIKKSIMTNHTFFTVVTPSKINSIAYINSIAMQHL